jgi:hypothetical protein
VTLQTFTLGTFAQQGAAAAGDFDSIATSNPSGVSTLTFSAIPGTYQHLQIRCAALDSSGAWIKIRFNSDTGSNYSYHALYGSGSSAGSLSGASQTSMSLFGSANGTVATYPNVGVVDILDYIDTSKYKTVRVLAGADMNGAGGTVEFSSGNWRSTSAVTSITIFTSGSFASNSHFALYGIKAA